MHPCIIYHELLLQLYLVAIEIISKSTSLRHDISNPTIPIKFKGLTYFYIHFLTKILNYLHTSIMVGNSIFYNLVIIISIHFHGVYDEITTHLESYGYTSNLNTLTPYKISTTKFSL